MICTKCCNEGVKNEALGQVFYYCRTCKVEIELTAPSDNHASYQDLTYVLTPDNTDADWVMSLDDAFQRLYRAN